MKKKKLLLIPILLILIIGVVVFQRQTKQPYNQELSKFVYSTGKGEALFSGTLDYGHSLKMKSKEEKNNYLTVTSSGVIGDLSDGESKKGKDFFQIGVTQIVSSDKIIEKIDGKQIDTFSIIKNKIIIKSPLTAKATWTQKVTYNKEEYTATSVISKIEKSKDGKRTIYVETKIPGIKSFSKDTYEETVAYEEGKGMVYFKRSLPLIDKGLTLSSFEYYRTN